MDTHSRLTEGIGLMPLMEPWVRIGDVTIGSPIEPIHALSPPLPISDKDALRQIFYAGNSLGSLIRNIDENDLIMRYAERTLDRLRIPTHDLSAWDHARRAVYWFSAHLRVQKVNRRLSRWRSWLGARSQQDLSLALLGLLDHPAYREMLFETIDHIDVRHAEWRGTFAGAMAVCRVMHTLCSLDVRIALPCILLDMDYKIDLFAFHQTDRLSLANRYLCLQIKSTSSDLSSRVRWLSRTHKSSSEEEQAVRTSVLQFSRDYSKIPCEPIMVYVGRATEPWGLQDRGALRDAFEQLLSPATF